MQLETIAKKTMKKDKRQPKTAPVAQTNGKIASLKKKKFRKKKKKSEKASAISEEVKVDGAKNSRIITHGDISVIKCNLKEARLEPVITTDSEHILCPCGLAVAVFRCKTGQLENLFTLHKYDVTNVYISRRNPAQVVSCSAREVLVWEYADMTLVKRHDVNFDVLHWYVNPVDTNEMFCKRQVKNQDCLELVKFNLEEEEEEERLGLVSPIAKCVTVTTHGELVAYSHKQELSIYPIWSESEHCAKPITCVVAHPTSSSIIATGHKNGTILIWHNISEERNHVRVKLHWHYTSFVDMAFSHDGNYLYSAGNEGVLVVWQLETKSSSFIPHLDSAVRHVSISSDDQFIVLTLRNNMIKIINATTSQLVENIKFLSEAYEVPAGVTYHPTTDCLVLNGIPDGIVQFYQPRTDKVKQSVDLVGENRITDFGNRYVYPTRVVRIVFSSDSQWMATVEEREDRLLPTDRKLKFWKYVEEKYELVTLIDSPHNGDIHTIMFRPIVSTNPVFKYMVLTTSSEGGEAKTWFLPHTEDEDEADQPQWQVHSVASYGSKLHGPASFSQNGEVLAILFGAVTLWDPDTLSFERCLEFCHKEETIVDIKFASNESSEYLIGRSARYLIVWSKETNSVVWMLEVNVSLIVSDPYSRYCAAFIKPKNGDQSTDLYVFDPACPTPKCLLRNVLNNPSSVVSAAVFIPNNLVDGQDEGVWSESGQLFILTDKTEIYAVKTKGIEREEIVEEIPEDERQEEPSPFSEIFGTKKSVTKIEVADNQPLGNPSTVFIRKMMSTPSNVLPSTDVLCKAFIKTLLLPRQQPTEDDISMDTTEEAVEMKKENSRLDGSAIAGKSDVYTPSKGLVKKLRRINFDFVQPIT